MSGHAPTRRIACARIALCAVACIPATVYAGNASISPEAVPTFVPLAEQSLLPAHVGALLTDRALGLKVVHEGTVVVGDSRYPVRIKLRKRAIEPAAFLRLYLRLGDRPPVEMFFKPLQKGYRDSATEVAVCQLALRLKIPVPPCGGRFIKVDEIARALAELPPDFRQRILVHKNQIYGFVRLWAPGYVTYLGSHRPSLENLHVLAGMLRVEQRAAVLRDPILRELPDLFLLDFLVYNNDRKWNLGTVRMTADELALFPIDFGDGLSASPRKKHVARELFVGTRLFRKQSLDELEKLTQADVKEALSAPGIGLLVEPEHIQMVLTVRRRALAHLRWVVHQFGKEALY